MSSAHKPSTYKRKRRSSPTPHRKSAKTGPETVVDTGQPSGTRQTTMSSEEEVPDPAQPAAPEPPATITKRDLLTRTDLSSGRSRVPLDDASHPDRPLLEAIHATFYDADGRWLVENEKELRPELEKVYLMMGYGDAEYAQVPATMADIVRLREIPNASVNSEKLQEADHQKQVAAGRPLQRPPDQRLEDIAPVLEKGDYFYVRNKNGRVSTAQRRIAVNVRSQEAAVKVAEAVGSLFSVDAVAPHVKDLKIYLTRRTDKPVKHDKLMVYYAPDDTVPGDEDTVGDRIAETIQNAVGPGDAVLEFAPFYSPIADGIAWTEEPKSFVANYSGSFTQFHAGMIKDIIRKNPTGMDFTTFVATFAKAIGKRGFDPSAPHRRLDEPSTST